MVTARRAASPYRTASARPVDPVCAAGAVGSHLQPKIETLPFTLFAPEPHFMIAVTYAKMLPKSYRDHEMPHGWRWYIPLPYRLEVSPHAVRAPAMRRNPVKDIEW
jgi:hypothetical protein